MRTNAESFLGLDLKWFWKRFAFSEGFGRPVGGIWLDVGSAKKLCFLMPCCFPKENLKLYRLTKSALLTVFLSLSRKYLITDKLIPSPFANSIETYILIDLQKRVGY